MCARRAAHAPSNDSDQMPHKLSYLGWTCSVRRRGDSHAQKERPCSLETRPASREKQFERAHAPRSSTNIMHRSTDVFLRDPLGRLACLSAPAERRPMQKRTSFPAAKRGLGWRLECVPIHAMISTFPLMWDCGLYEAIRGPALLALGLWMTKRHRNPDRTPLRRDLDRFVVRYGNHYLVWHPSR